MNWVFIALIGGSLITSGHETEEQCLGRKAMIEKNKEVTYPQCVMIQHHTFTSSQMWVACPGSGGYVYGTTQCPR